MFGYQHLYGGKNQKGPENIGHKTELLDQCHPEEDHQCPEHNGPQNTPEKHTMLVFLGNMERTEDHCNDKDVVNAQG